MLLINFTGQCVTCAGNDFVGGIITSVLAIEWLANARTVTWYFLHVL